MKVKYSVRDRGQENELNSKEIWVKVTKQRWMKRKCIWVGDGEKRMMERMSEVESRSLQRAWRVMSNDFKFI
jgi:hypothetical protein